VAEVSAKRYAARDHALLAELSMLDSFLYVVRGALRALSASAAFVGALLPAARAAAQDERFAQGLEVLRDAGGAEVRVPWKLLKPTRIEEGVRYPLVLFLHGAGERGDDNSRQLTWFGNPMASPAWSEAYPCYVLAPQCPKDRRWVEVDWSAKESARPAEPSPAMEGVQRALRAVLAQHPIDTERLYLTGLSMGGFGTWDLAARHPTWFAAAAPICGGGDPRDAARLASLPLWCFHGADDKVVQVERSRAMIGALEAVGGAPIYTELQGVGHDSWKSAYSDDSGLLPWLFAQRRGAGALAALAAAPWREGDKIAFLGDSITQAGGAPGGYVTRLEAALRDQRAELEIPFVRAGISGNKIGDLLARYERDVLAAKPTLAFVYIGINDVWHQKLYGKGTPEAEFGAGLRELCTKLGAAGVRVVLATPSVIGEKRAGENALDAELDRYAGITRAVAAELGLQLCDLRADCMDRLALENAGNAEQGILTNDGVHLTPAGNAFVAERAATAIALSLHRRQG
jgi:lysophospholipase L1-like esterase/poly(3-hydroxybutyrate) depolymerase